MKFSCPAILLATSLALAMPVLSAHAQHRIIRGDGHSTTETRTVSGFNRIHCSGSYHIIVREGAATSLRVEADENLMPYIITEIKGNTLDLSNKKNTELRHSKPVNIYLTVNHLAEIGVSGACNLKTQDMLQVDRLKISISGSAEMNMQLTAHALAVNISGSGKLTLSGASQSGSYHVSGSADVFATGLTTDNTEIHISGMGKMHVDAQKKLAVTVSGMGNVWYKGNPEISQSVSGMGKIAQGG